MEYVFPALDYTAWLSRAEFGSHEETVDHANRQIFRSYQGHKPGEVPNELFKLRYDVYCIERAFLNADDAFDGMEFDDYDDRSTHFAAYTMDETLIGTVRLVTPRPLQPFPFQLHCATFNHFRMLSHHQCGEISRLAVKHPPTAIGADSVRGIPGFAPLRQQPLMLTPEVERRNTNSPMLLLGMYREMYRHSRAKGIRYWFAAMERSLAYSLEKMGFLFRAIGPVSDYYGEVTPYLLDLGELMPELAARNPPLGAWLEEKPLVFAEPRSSHVKVRGDKATLDPGSLLRDID
ncbi:PEP-CTERM/exosortase system-associated acyltransferase [Massilia sp. B-10]|nr:PEP-CTERM/exosortase system-associated acyltransferase [Massilia sp. B-10]